jgi:hypothetical protein
MILQDPIITFIIKLIKSFRKEGRKEGEGRKEI